MKDIIEVIVAPETYDLPTVIFIIGLCIILISIAIMYLKKKTLEDIRKDVYQLFLKAEHLMRDSGDGETKMEWVIDQTYLFLPRFVQFFVTRNMLKVLFEKWFLEIKDLLDDGKNNDSAKFIEDDE